MEEQTDKQTNGQTESALYIQGDPFEKFTDERPCTKETTGQKKLKLGL
jgi:hypothetical protein